MRFRFERYDTLPRLAWCARVTRGEDEVVVYHGPWVETRPTAFVEGAWDAGFPEDGFDRAVTFCGSGGRLVADGVVFASASHLYEPLRSLRVRDGFLVSNSMVFLLVEAGDSPDLAYPHYYLDLLEYWREGTARRTKTLPTRRGNRVHLHHGRNLLVRPDLSVEFDEKPAPAVPRSYAEHVEQLTGTLGRLLENAAHPARGPRYRPLAMVSQGYDAGAFAVLLSGLGCREAMTYVPGGPEDWRPDDRGTAIARQLGMETTEYARLAFKRLPGLPEAEFHASPHGEDANLAVAEAQLAGTVLVTGRNGDIVWDRDPRKVLPDHRKPTDQTLPGTTLGEFRLRVGFVQCVVLTTHIPFASALLRISDSPEMRPWSVGGDYDRPIPRRLLEEAGVPRASFGQTKAAGAVHRFLRLEDMSPAGAEDFTRFRRVLPAPGPARRLRFGLMHALYQLTDLPARLARRQGWRWRGPMHDRYRRWPAPLLYTFHWGFERIRDRYGRGRA